MVAAPVAEFQLVGGPAVGQRQNLMAQADAEDGGLAQQGPDGLNHHPHVLGVSGAVGEEDAVRLHVENFLHAGVVGHHSDVAAELV